MAAIKYECEVCDEKGFECRADWLVHLGLDRHSVKARENLQQLYLQSDGNLYVVNGIGPESQGSLLEYVGESLPTAFTNFVSFKPQADVCMICVSDPREFERFATASATHEIGETLLKFRNYNEITPVELKSFFSQTETEVKTEGNRMQEKEGENGNTKPSPSSSDMSTACKRKINDAAANPESQCGGKVAKVEPEDESDDSDSNNGTSDTIDDDVGSTSISVKTEVAAKPPPPPRDSATYAKWGNEINEIFKSIQMPEAEANIRMTIVTELKSHLRWQYPHCELIPVGTDFLGLGIHNEVFNIYFDSQGATNPENPNRVWKIAESDEVTRRKQNSLTTLLKSEKVRGGPLSFSQVFTKIIGKKKKDKAFTTVDFVCLVHGQFRLKCAMFLRPFRMAETALLCKQLYLMKPESMFLIRSITYWAKPWHGDFADSFLPNPFLLFWLVYFFLITKKILPPVLQLQTSCNYQILDEQCNVAFSYESNLLNPIVSGLGLAKDGGDNENVQSNVELLLEWFTYISTTLGEADASGRNVRRHSVICPRIGKLIDKAHFKGVKKQSKKAVEVLKTREETLRELELDESAWNQLKKQRLREDFCIQHPFYISTNIAMKIRGPEMRSFFGALKEMRGRLTQLLEGTLPSDSLIEALSAST